MALKFQCENCGKDIAVRFLKVGETAECKTCGASNPVSESAQEITDEAAERMIKVPVSKPAKDISAEAVSHAPVQSVPIAKVLRIVGRVLIAVGVIAGIVAAMRVLTQHPAPDQTMALAISMGVTWLMNVFFFCILSVLCSGIAKGVELLSR